MSTDERDPYAALLALTEREHALVSAGALDELPALQGERERLMSRLAGSPHAADAGSLRRAAALQAQTAGLLGAALQQAERELERLHRGRTAVRGYGGSTAASRTLDLRR